MKTHTNWTKYQTDFLLLNYENMLTKTIAFRLNKTRSAVVAKAWKLNLKANLSNKTKKFTCNDNYFKIPNLQNSYWAGFIAADGSINSKRKLLEIAINEKDSEHLKKFKKHVNFKGNIGFNKSDNCVRLAISSSRFCLDLKNNYSIIPKKSLILKRPNIKNLKHKLAFIAGYIDGDGCIWYRNNNIVLEILGTKNMLNWIKKIFTKDLHYDNLIAISKKQNIYRLRITSNNIRKILNNIKRLGLPLLGRKWDKI